MKKPVMGLFLLVLLSLALCGSAAIAKGRRRRGDVPSGWGKGEKRGRQSDAPQGLGHEGKKKKMEGDRRQIRRRERDGVNQEEQLQKEKQGRGR